jgi:hypothetical protein
LGPETGAANEVIVAAIICSALDDTDDVQLVVAGLVAVAARSPEPRTLVLRPHPLEAGLCGQVDELTGAVGRLVRS